MVHLLEVFSNLQLFEDCPVLQKEPGRIVNIDEKALPTNYKSLTFGQSVVSKLEQKFPALASAQSSNSCHITGLFSCSASGEKGPRMYITPKRDNVPDKLLSPLPRQYSYPKPICLHGEKNSSIWLTAVGTGWFSSAGSQFKIQESDSGYVDKYIFPEYVKDVVKWTRDQYKEGKILITLDGASVHNLSDSLLDILLDNPDVIFFYFPHNTSVWTQALDNGVFGLFQKLIMVGIHNLLIAGYSMTIPPDDLVSKMKKKERDSTYSPMLHTSIESRTFGLVEEPGHIKPTAHIVIAECAWYKIEMRGIRASFEKTGMYPFNKYALSHLIEKNEVLPQELSVQDYTKKCEEVKNILESFVAPKQKLESIGELIFNTSGLLISSIERHRVQMQVAAAERKKAEEIKKSRRKVEKPRNLKEYYSKFHRNMGYIDAEVVLRGSIDAIEADWEDNHEKIEDTFTKLVEAERRLREECQRSNSDAAKVKYKKNQEKIITFKQACLDAMRRFGLLTEYQAKLRKILLLQESKKRDESEIVAADELARRDEETVARDLHLQPKNLSLQVNLELITALAAVEQESASNAVDFRNDLGNDLGFGDVALDGSHLQVLSDTSRIVSNSVNASMGSATNTNARGTKKGTKANKTTGKGNTNATKKNARKANTTKTTANSEGIGLDASGTRTVHYDLPTNLAHFDPSHRDKRVRTGTEEPTPEEMASSQTHDRDLFFGDNGPTPLPVNRTIDDFNIN